MAMKPNTLAALVCAIALVASGCATIMQGTTQPIGVSSNPPGAVIRVNNIQQAAVTPAILNLKRSDHHVISIELPGYQPYSATLTRSLSGWVVGNIVFGGLIGLVVDAASGGMYKLSPEQVTGEMIRVGRAEADDTIYLAVVLFPENGWEKVGQLEPISTGASPALR